MDRDRQSDSLRGGEKGTHCMISQELRGVECCRVAASAAAVAAEDWEIWQIFLQTTQTGSRECAVSRCSMLTNVLVAAIFWNYAHTWETTGMGVFPCLFTSSLSKSHFSKRLLQGAEWRWKKKNIRLSTSCKSLTDVRGCVCGHKTVRKKNQREWVDEKNTRRLCERGQWDKGSARLSGWG